MNLLVARILARYVAGGLVSYGLLTPDLASELAVDPDVAMIIGTGLGAASEGLYLAAKRFGWKV